MSFQGVQERLRALQDTNAQLQILINRLSSLKFQPGSIPLGGLEGDVSEELTAEIHQTIKDQDEDFELIQQEIGDIPSGRPGSDQNRQAARLTESTQKISQDLHLNRIAFRRAQLTAKRNFESAQRLERRLLFSSLTDLPADDSHSTNLFARRNEASKPSELSKDEKMINATSDVTLALRRTHALMSTELSRSQFAHDTLRESTAALAQLGESYSTLDTLLSSSKNLLSTLLRSQKSDTWYLETAFYVLAATIAWLIFRRFIYGPTWWIIWVPTKIFYKAWMGIFAAVGLRGRDKVTDMGYMDVVKEAGLPTLVQHNSATRASSGPKSSGFRRPPSVNVGGGGRGAPPTATEPGIAPEETMIEEVVRIVEGDEGSEVIWEESADSESVEIGDLAENNNAPNPKKRVWDEDIEAEKAQTKPNDEL